MLRLTTGDVDRLSFGSVEGSLFAAEFVKVEVELGNFTVAVVGALADVDAGVLPGPCVESGFAEIPFTPTLAVLAAGAAGAAAVAFGSAS